MIYANNIDDDDDSPTRNASNNNFYSARFNYFTNDLILGATYHYIGFSKPENSQRTYTNLHNLSVGGAYDFKVAKISAFIAYNKINAKNNLAEFNNKKSLSHINYMLGAVIPFGKHTAKTSFNYSHNSKNQYGNAWQLAIGYDYNFSKRTNFYAAYSYINADKSKADGSRLGRINAGVADASNNAGMEINGLYSAYKQGFQLGIKHSF